MAHLLLLSPDDGPVVDAVALSYRCCSRGIWRSKGSSIEKISNKSSFGIIDIAESSTSDRIIVIVEIACLIDDGAYRWRSGRHVNVSASH